jgi:hypothetical protein
MLPSFANLPEHLRSVIEPLCMEAEQRGYARGKADGQAELLCGIKAVQQLVSPIPPAMPLSMTAAMPVNLSQPAPQPSEFEQATDGDESDGEDFDFDAILDGLFDGQWSDAEKQEILGIAIVAVREAADAQGVDPEPFVERLKALAGNPQAAERVMMGHPVWLAWVPERIDNPRGKYQYRARDTDTGRVVYGAEAERKLRKDHAGGDGVPSADDVTRENKEYLEARTKARENVDAVTQKLAQGQMLKKPEWDEFHDQLSYLTGQQLKEVRKTMMDRLAAKVKGGKRKGDRIGNLQSAIKSVVQFGVTRSFQEDYDKLAGESLADVVKQYGGIDPDDHEFQRHFGSASEAREYGVATKKGGKSLDDLAKNLISAGHLVVPEGMDETQALVDALQGKKKAASADDGQFWDERYKQHAAQQELDAMDAPTEPAPEVMGDMDAAGVGGGDASFDFGANAAEPEVESEPVVEEQPMMEPEPAEVTVEAGDEQPAAETDGRDQSRAAIDARLAESGLPTGLSDDVLKQIPLDENRGFDDDGNPTYYKSKAPAETRAYIANLTPEEVKAVGQYAGSMNFGGINTLLRGGVDDPTNDSKHGQIIKNLDAVFDKAPELKTSIKTYRGINIPQDTLKNWLDEVQSASSAGRPFEDMAFFSTSTDQSAISGYGNVGMEITARHGIDASPLSNAQSENEFLLPRGSKFRIIGVENHDGRPVIKLDQIVQRDAEPTATQPEQSAPVDAATEPVVEATDAPVDALPIGKEPTPDDTPTEPAPTVSEPEATAEPEPAPVAPPKLTPQQVAARDKAMDDAVKAAQRKAPGGRLTPEQRAKVRADAKSKYESSLGQPAPQAEAKPVSAADAERASQRVPAEDATGRPNQVTPKMVQANDGKWYLPHEIANYDAELDAKLADTVDAERAVEGDVATVGATKKVKEGARYETENKAKEFHASTELMDLVEAGQVTDEQLADVAERTGLTPAKVKELHGQVVSDNVIGSIMTTLNDGGKIDDAAVKRIAEQHGVDASKVKAEHAEIRKQQAFSDLRKSDAMPSESEITKVAKAQGLNAKQVADLTKQLTNAYDPTFDPAPTKKGKAEPAPKAPAKAKGNPDQPPAANSGGVIESLKKDVSGVSDRIRGPLEAAIENAGENPTPEELKRSVNVQLSALINSGNYDDVVEFAGVMDKYGIDRFALNAVPDRASYEKNHQYKVNTDRVAREMFGDAYKWLRPEQREQVDTKIRRDAGITQEDDDEFSENLIRNSVFGTTATPPPEPKTPAKAKGKSPKKAEEATQPPTKKAGETVKRLKGILESWGVPDRFATNEVAVHIKGLKEPEVRHVAESFGVPFGTPSQIASAITGVKPLYNVMYTANQHVPDTPEEQTATRERVRGIIGSDLSHDDATAIVMGGVLGGIDGTPVVTIRDSAGGRVVLETYIDGSHSLRTLSRDRRGKLVCHNDLFRLSDDNKDSGGYGTQAFAEQVDALRRMGVDRIETLAARSKNMNGYYTWPRLGYDGRIPAKKIAKLPPDLKSQMGESKMISTLFKTEAGREWWKQNGVSLPLRFDLSPESDSSRTLASYLAERSNRGTKSKE